ncbi:hypothetical protein [Sphingobacterium gobiense]|uniref:Uncharacterized protein n=1 Tax=Sphingobacterium gobiense TaxID=1382456 RepID=A0A2S9JNK4_9SPHI|nr:hypothetical protein [Sphingobacterium gobiense]PRD54688.1 hypothetical protein C5749_14745 [Sphingobacterium gobiense]
MKRIRDSKKINLSWLIETYSKVPNKEIFFDNKQSKEIVVFDKLAGGPLLEKQVISGMSEEDIREKYLIYE